jgi:hypothetical protein
MSEALSKVEADRQLLIDAQKRGRLATLGAYTKLSGPGWLQSAITLGGGSLASSLYLGVLAGTTMLWLQPLAMILGIIMLSAIAYVTLSTGERPFRAINNHVNPVLGWSWLLASLMANMVWALPQYSLFYGVMEQNLMPGVLGPGGALEGDIGKWVTSGVVLVISTIVVWSYGSGSWGIKIYELMLKAVVGVIVVCFFAVVARMSMRGAVDWSGVWTGFVPHWRQLFEPAANFHPMLEAITDPVGRQYWTDLLVAKQRDVMISAAATAVGINMTFLLPYSMLARGWGKNFRGLATFDLSTGMFIPFVLATSCVVIAAAAQFHTAPMPGFLGEADAEGQPVVAPGRAANEYSGLLAGRLKATLGDEPYSRYANDPEGLAAQVESLPEADRRLAAALVTRDAFDLSRSLERLTGSKLISDVLFGLGVAGMTLSTISLLMLISGFAICEIANVPATGWTHRIGCLAAASGALWPLLWSGQAQFWLAIVASVFGMALLPVAYLTFWLLFNQRSLLGKEMPTGFRRVWWNSLLAIAATAATGASAYVIWTKVGMYGVYGVAALLGLALVVQVFKAAAPQK